MPNLPISGANTLFKVGDGATPTEAFTAVAEVRSISGPSITVDTTDTTSMTSGVWRRKVPTLIDAGEVTFDIAFMPMETGHADLYQDLKDRVLRNFKVVFPTTPAWEWSISGYVTGFEQEFPMDDVITTSVTITLVGEPTLAAAA
jgi:hypothetical protein